MTKNFGTTRRGETVTLIELDNGALSLEALDYGATIRALRVKNAEGGVTDVVLGYDTIEEYEANDGYLGALVGRVANRTARGRFTLSGREYTLAKNIGENHLHGGMRGFDKYVWDYELLPDGVRFTRVSPDGEEGYPGALTASVSYILRGETLVMSYEARSDADTLCNLTNHSYFNLDGGGDILRHALTLDAESYTETDAESIPTGRLISVGGTAFDFRREKEIGRDIASGESALVGCGGYDHNYALNGAQLRPVALLRAARLGITMELATTLPGLQLYTANYLSARRGKGGAQYGKWGAVCLETQFFPDAANHEDFETPILRAGGVWRHTTELRFGR